jgi:ATP-binding cassette subfamily F protein uup
LINFESGTISSRYPAPFGTYQRLRKEAQQEESKTKSSSVRLEAVARNEKPRPRKLSYKEQQELSDLEARIESLETQKKVLQDEINRSGSDYQRLQDLAGQLQAVEVELEASMERWLELEEVAG